MQRASFDMQWDHTHLCTCLWDSSVLWSSLTISVHLYLPVPTSPCLPAPHLVVILGNGGVCTPTPSPKHHSLCVDVCACVCVTADPSHSKNIVLPIRCQCAAFLPPLRRLQPLFFSFLFPSLLVDPGSLCYFIVRIEKCAEKVLKYFKLRRLERRQEAGCKMRGCMIHFFPFSKKMTRAADVQTVCSRHGE